MDIRQATEAYETWLGKQLRLIPADLELKHQRMAESPFLLLRATFYRWVQRWPEVCPELAAAPVVLSVGDLHIENFGTWRDAEGRLIWGINDFDEAYPMPYATELVRLAASAILAVRENHLSLDPQDACDAILAGYREMLDQGGCPFVLAQRHQWLRDIAESGLRDPAAFWDKLDKLPTATETIAPEVKAALERWLPQKGLPYRVVHRIAGLGSLGRQRLVALADWQGGLIAREAKALAVSACLWEKPPGAAGDILYQRILGTSVRVLDPWVQLSGSWLVRRLAPDCSRVGVAALPKDRDEQKLLHAMGQETANIHAGDSRAKAAILADLNERDSHWLWKAAEAMAEATQEDWKQWRKERVA
ncbi:MAG: DUF2252 family protein [Thermoguttaceae bacterium]|jgi:hypothetical protein